MQPMLLVRGSVFCSLFCFALPLLGQDQDLVRGSVRDSSGNAVASAEVHVTPFGATASRTVRTNPQGFYQMLMPGTGGDYLVVVQAAGFARSQRRVQRDPSASADEPIIADFELIPVPAARLAQVQTTAPRRQRAGPATDGSDVGSNAMSPPDGLSTLGGDLRGDLASAFAMLPGVSLADGGFSVLGLDPDQNAVTIGTMTFGGSALPRDVWLTPLNVATSNYDVSRGGYSGGLATLNPGTITGQWRPVNVTLEFPMAQWTPRSGPAQPRKQTAVDVSGTVTKQVFGPKGSLNVWYQLGHRSSPLASLPVNDADALRALGLSSDSVSRLFATASATGLPLGASLPARSTSAAGSIFTTLGYSPDATRSFSTRTVLSWNRLEGASLGATSHPSHGANQRSLHLTEIVTFTQYFRSVFSNAARLGVSLGEQDGRRYVDAPAAYVMMASDLGDELAAPTMATVRLGGNPSPPERQRNWSLELQDDIGWFSLDAKHRFKFALGTRVEGYRAHRTPNTSGTFSFMSLEDFERSAPATFTRTLGEQARGTSAMASWAALTDAWRPNESLRVTFGVRAEQNRFLSTPARNELVETTFGERTDRAPTSVGLMPAAGFTFAYGTLPERLGGLPAALVGRVAGTVAAPRATIVGGVAKHQGRYRARQLDRALIATGLPSGIEEILCIGAAVPVPAWHSYAMDATTIPTACADGGMGSPQIERAASVHMVAPEFAPAESWRANLGWRGRLTRALDARFEATYSLNLDQPSSVDLNFAATPHFALAAEAGRPVYVDPGSIVPATGAVTVADSRRSPLFSRVIQARSDAGSTRAQFMAIVSGNVNNDPRRRFQLGYSYLVGRDRTRGFSATTGGDPSGLEWTPAANHGQHSLTLFSHNLFGRQNLQIQFFSRLTSGRRYTPRVSGDINGDGLANDRAFVFDTRSAPADITAGMSSLLANSHAARRCLDPQVGGVAAPNSCRGPWSASLNAKVAVPAGTHGLPARLGLAANLQNALAAADLLLHGRSRARGWGQSQFPETTLLTVRGFDPAAQQFIYSVNPRFGQKSRAVGALWAPFRLTLQANIDVGPDRRRLAIEEIRHGGRARMNIGYPRLSLADLARQLIVPEAARASRAHGVLWNYRDSIGVTQMQLDSLAALLDDAGARYEAIMTPLAQYLVDLGGAKYSVKEVQSRIDSARSEATDVLVDLREKLLAVLTDEQIAKLPPSALRLLRPDQ